MVSVSSALQRIKDDLRPFLPDQAIVTACAQAKHRWRQRQLGPVQTIHLFIQQVLNFNTAMTALGHLSKTAVKPAAYCRARMRLPLDVLQALLLQSSTAMRQTATQAALWCGLRVHLVDGSSAIAPDTCQSQKVFGQPTGQKKGCGFPVPKVLGLFDAFTGLIVQILAFPLFTHEQSKVWMLHPLLRVGDLLVGDRGFCSFTHLAMLSARGIDGLFRVQRTIVDFRPHRKTGGRGRPKGQFIKHLGPCDQIVQWRKPRKKPLWMSDEQYQALPPTLEVRELRFRLPRKGQRTWLVTLVTTLLDPVSYPKQKVAQLYGVRWRVETHFAQLKTTLKMRRVKSQTPQGVLKELTVYALVYNLVHAVMLQAALSPGCDPGSDQLHRHAALAAQRFVRGGIAKIAGQSAPTRPPRATCDQRPSGHLPQDDAAPQATAKTPRKNKAMKLM
jgi:hypothetical protein